MSTTDESTGTGDGAAGGGAPPRPPTARPPWQKAARRYGPIAAVVALAAGALVAFGGRGDDSDSDGGDAAASGGVTASEEELIRSGPMTPQKAELEGLTDVDFGPDCDTERGQIKLPAVLVPPCVEPFEGDNGGATSPGVTADEIKLVYYQTDPALDPLGAAMIGGAGADINTGTGQQVVEDLVDVYNQVFETYGRRVTVETFTGTGASDDRAAAKADAIAIAEKHPFAVVGGPAQATTAFETELATRGVLCGPNCAGGGEDILEEFAPYLWPVGPTPNQAAQLASEMVGKLAGPGPAAMAGDPELQEQDRVYGLVHYDTPEGEHRPVFEGFAAALADNGVELATDVEFFLDPARMQENARTVVNKLESAGVTTVIFYGDPLTPAALTKEATAQDYHPEWILGPNVLADTTIFARQTDGEQWSHGFGIALIPARGPRDESDAWKIYEWAYGNEPPNNTVSVLEAPLRLVFSGIHLAGPDLSPETFADGMHRAPVGGGGPTVAQFSMGEHGVWPDFDWGGADDAAILWWDPTATGEDEVGAEGTGMYRYANGGERYTIGEFPDSPEEAGLFDDGSSVTVYDHLPASDQTPDYPPPR
jgi:Periplasmic binding protein